MWELLSVIPSALEWPECPHLGHTLDTRSSAAHSEQRQLSHQQGSPGQTGRFVLKVEVRNSVTTASIHSASFGYAGTISPVLVPLIGCAPKLPTTGPVIFPRTLGPLPHPSGHGC